MFEEHQVWMYYLGTYKEHFHHKDQQTESPVRLGISLRLLTALTW